MNTKVIGMVLVVLVVVAGVFVLLQNTSKTQAPTTSQEPTQEANPSSVMESSPSGTIESTGTGEVKGFSVTGSAFKFSPATMTVNKGDTVRIVFKNGGGMHDFVLDEFDVRTEVLQDGGSETVEFVANKAGEFEYYCSVSDHRQKGMVGTLTVKE